MNKALYVNRTAPYVNVSTIPEAEREHFSAFSSAMQELQTYILNFYSALNLFNEIARQINSNEANIDHLRSIGSWRFIAARDGAMSIYHFGAALEGARYSISQCKSLFSHIDRNKLKESSQVFKSGFLMSEKMRHAIAHAGELFTRKDKAREHSFRGEYKTPHISLKNESPNLTMIVSNGLQGNMFTNTFMGEIVTYAVDETSLSTLIISRDHFYDALENVNQHSRP